MEYKNKITLRGIVGQVHDKHMSVATSRIYKDASNGIIIDTTWHNVNFSSALLLGAPEKGSKVEVEGYVKHQQYTSNDGIRRDVQEVVASSVSVLETDKPLAYERPLPIDVMEELFYNARDLMLQGFRRIAEAQDGRILLNGSDCLLRRNRPEDGLAEDTLSRLGYIQAGDNGVLELHHAWHDEEQPHTEDMDLLSMDELYNIMETIKNSK